LTPSFSTSPVATPTAVSHFLSTLRIYRLSWGPLDCRLVSS
jgi:hypothetical protein